jgi:hypothetical protein
MFPQRFAIGLSALAAVGLMSWGVAPAAEDFEGRFFRGKGDVEYFQLLDISRRMFEPDPEFQSMPMLYMPAWNGLVEGPTWGAWWIQNSYGPTYCALPFWQEPFVTFIKNSHDLWFDQMGDGKRVGASPPHNWIAPDGALCDAAAPNWIIYKQGDGRIDIHDWGMEFTAAGLVMQAELLLIDRDAKAIAHYLPKLERCANFIETRRDPNNNLFLAGAAGNLLAPSYAGWKRPDGTYDKAYLSGLSITCIAGLDRLIELEKLAGNSDKAALYSERRELARKGLPRLMTEEGYFIKYLDPDGTRHGVYGAPKHGYFEAICNHDAVCFRVVDDAQAEKIYAKIASIPGLRRHDLIITNCPSLDDTYHPDLPGIWKFGHWVNGGHWSTCEARMIMGYYRLGKYDDARRSMKQIMKFARRFRMDNNLVDFGNDVYQPHQPINCVYDTYGVPAAMIRGLFEYLYRADGLTILPHIPPGITELDQRFPIRYGQKRLFLSTVGTGDITTVLVNGQPWKSFDAKSVFLPYDQTLRNTRIQIALGGAALTPSSVSEPAGVTTPPQVPDDLWTSEWIVKAMEPKPLPLRIGADSNGKNRFVGDIARARLFGRALTGDEIAALARDEAGELSKDTALVGDWAFANLKDGAFANAVGGYLPAKVVNDVKVVDSPHGKAIRLTGKGYLEVAHDARLELPKAYTLEAWISPKSLPGGGARIIDKSTVGTADNYLLDTCPGNSLRLITRRGSLSFDAKLPPDQWSHVAATFEAQGELRLYVNGKLAASMAAQGPAENPGSIESLRASYERLRRLHNRLIEAGLAESYEAAHARLALEYVATLDARRKLLADGKIQPLPEVERQQAADKSYIETAAKLCDGLQNVLKSYAKSQDAQKKRVCEIWNEVLK